jgi:ferrochelatase
MTVAVLLVAHGTVESTDDLPAFLKNVRRGNDAPDDLVQQMRYRYEKIGGKSPLLEITRSVAAKLEARLGLPVRAAMRLWKPYPRDVLAQMSNAGIERVIVLPLAQFSTHVYVEAVRHDLAELVSEGARNMELVPIGPWGQTPALLDAQAARIRAVLQPLPAASREKTGLVLSAHSLPSSVIAAGDPYEKEFLASALGIKQRISMVAWHVRHAYQSQGVGGGEWLGPDLRSVMEAARGAAFVRVVVAPIGFLADHLEILYDIDIEAKERATGLGLELSRTESLNDADDFIQVLEGLVRPHVS